MFIDGSESYPIIEFEAEEGTRSTQKLILHKMSSVLLRPILVQWWFHKVLSFQYISKLRATQYTPKPQQLNIVPKPFWNMFSTLCTNRWFYNDYVFNYITYIVTVLFSFLYKRSKHYILPGFIIVHGGFS